MFERDGGMGISASGPGHRWQAQLSGDSRPRGTMASSRLSVPRARSSSRLPVQSVRKAREPSTLLRQDRRRALFALPPSAAAAVGACGVAAGREPHVGKKLGGFSSAAACGRTRAAGRPCAPDPLPSRTQLALVLATHDGASAALARAAANPDRRSARERAWRAAGRAGTSMKSLESRSAPDRHRPEARNFDGRSRGRGFSLRRRATRPSHRRRGQVVADEVVVERDREFEGARGPRWDTWPGARARFQQRPCARIGRPWRTRDAPSGCRESSRRGRDPKSTRERG